MQLLEAFATLPGWVLLGFVGALGLMIGSFLNVVIYRLPRDESLVSPGSHCPGCGAAVAWYDNVPVLAYLWLRGRCRRCGAGISWRYPAVELLVGALFLAIAWRFGLQPMTLLSCAFAAALVAAAVIDFDHQIIPDEISLGGLLLALLLAGGSVACREEGPAEKLGRQLDEAAQDAGEALEEATEEAKKKLANE